MYKLLILVLLLPHLARARDLITKFARRARLRREGGGVFLEVCVCLRIKGAIPCTGVSRGLRESRAWDLIALGSEYQIVRLATMT